MTSSRFQISPRVQAKLKELDLSAEEVIRKALDIKAEGFDAGEDIHFPEGTVLLAWYKDAAYIGRIKEGSIVMDGTGKHFNSLSGAAASITGRPTTNGWDWWLSIKLAGKNEFIPLKTLRKQ